MNKPTHKSIYDSGDGFVAHLENASRIVSEWPAWKQGLLGGGIHTHVRSSRGTLICDSHVPPSSDAPGSSCTTSENKTNIP